ncbi:Signal recognition particle receptor alpha subunit [Entamoeba marina]
MLEEINIITKGGVVLFNKNYSKLRGDPINFVIKNYLLADRTGENSATYENYMIHWLADNETNTIILVVHIKTIKVDYISSFIQELALQFKTHYLPNKRVVTDVMETTVETVLKEAQQRSKEEKANKKMRKFEETKKGIEIIKPNVISGSGSTTTYNFEGMQKKSYKQNSNVLQKMFSSFGGTRVVDEKEALEQSEKIETLLIEKNVNSEIASQIKSNIQTLLNGKKVDTFTLRGTVIQGVSEVLTRIMTPKDLISIPKEIDEKKAKGEVFTTVFLGVNGVGKSTSLSKVACWLSMLKYKVMIAGCDTFRAGAVDQLEVHAKKLGIPLYQEGYDKDPSAIARNALKYAKENNFDVLLIDTAGRMQGNDALMKAIAKLVHSAQTDLVLFVAEALVGNDAVNQLTIFNRYIVDHAPNNKTKNVNGIILTKFDTVDDKVGAAVSLTYCTGIPIVFVGTGQQYTDLELMDVDKLINSLLN